MSRRKQEAPKRPQQWEHMVLAAYLFMSVRKITKEQVATQMRRTRQTIYNWMASPHWADARAEARRRWFDNATDRARATVLLSIEAGNVSAGQWLLERTDDDLAPPKLKHELTGKDGDPIEVNVAELRSRMATRIAGLASRIGTNGATARNGAGGG